MLEKIVILKDGEFADLNGNVIQLRGVNLDPSVKIPAQPYLSTHTAITNKNRFFKEAASVSFVNHPLPLDEVEVNINRLKSLGFNTIRLPFTWESIEHEGPEIYDYEYMDYLIELLQKINKIGGMYIYLDPHQDVWSRFCGGSGAPLWTLLCAGFQPTNFKETKAAILHNYHIDPKSGRQDMNFLKMLWTTNYFRLACQTMFTLFFAGKQFAPKCIINGQNIQDYLQDKFNNAIMELYSRIQKKAPELFQDNCIIGLESINEPNNGYVGEHTLDSVPKDRQLKLGTTPSTFQSFMLGEGIDCKVDYYEISVMGPSKTGSKEINTKGLKSWLNEKDRKEVDEKYGWKRNKEWIAGQCIWRLHGVWKIESNGTPILLKPKYFSEIKKEGSTKILPVNEKYFINNYFVNYYEKYYKRFRAIDKESFIFIQPPILKEPPNLKSSKIIDDKTICACHFYDGYSLMFKTWNQYFNVDTFGIIRGKYNNPVFSVVLGEDNIRKSIRKQLKLMKDEVALNLGSNVGVFFTEIGMPFDMNNKSAYSPEGNYDAQIRAMDAIFYSLEGSNLSFSIWCYCYNNSHEWGDGWNNEDFSIWSKDDLQKIPSIDYETKSKFIIDSSHTDEKSDISSDINIPSCCVSKIDLSGFRALPALMRPFPIKIHGKFQYAKFDLLKTEYQLKIHATPGSDPKDSVSYIFLPQYHFPIKDVSIRYSSGKFIYYDQFQILKWYHDAGSQHIKIQLHNNHNNEDNGCILC